VNCGLAGTIACGRSLCRRRESATPWTWGADRNARVTEAIDFVHAFFQKEFPFIFGGFWVQSRSSIAARRKGWSKGFLKPYVILQYVIHT
jgi:hypothetical protein